MTKGRVCVRERGRQKGRERLRERQKESETERERNRREKSERKKGNEIYVEKTKPKYTVNIITL